MTGIGLHSINEFKWCVLRDHIKARTLHVMASTASTELDARLHLCYYAIFEIVKFRADGVDLHRWRDFKRSHLNPASGRHRIQNLADFCDHFDEVLELFRDNNFIEEYKTEHQHTETFRPDHVTYDQAVYRLKSLYKAIWTKGVDAVLDRIRTYKMMNTIGGVLAVWQFTDSFLGFLAVEELKPGAAFDNLDNYCNQQPDYDDSSSRLFGDRGAKENIPPERARVVALLAELKQVGWGD